MSDKLIELTDAWIIEHLGELALREMSGEAYTLIELFLQETGRA